MKNYTVLAKYESKIHEEHFDSIQAAYEYFNRFIEVMVFEWAELIDHDNAEVIEYVEQEEWVWG